MTALEAIKVEIEAHRKHARRLRKQADSHDVTADKLRAEAAKLATDTMLFIQGLNDGKDS